ncbi:MAG: hypothetical protein K9N10_04635 [Deltaproteobacteria bacterium]|nr:hypothetical protein [Deltaproteobacteria bacterium]
MSKMDLQQDFYQAIKPFRVSDVYLSLGVAAVALLIYFSFIAIMLTQTNNNLYGFYGFPDGVTNGETKQTPWKDYAHPKPGYDGQFYFRLALDPFTDKKTAFGITLDAPIVRHQRVLLPLFTWLIAGGNPETTPLIMMAINLAAIAGCALVGALLLSGFGVSAWYGLLFSLYPGFAVSAGRFLTEPLALFMILSSLLMLVHRKHFAAAITLSLAVLARETSTLVVAAGFFTWLSVKISKKSSKSSFQPAVSFWVYPTLSFFLWQFWLWNNWSSVLLDRENIAKLGVPLAGFFHAMAGNITNLKPETGFYMLMAVALFLYQVFICRFVRRYPLLLLISWASYFMLAVCTKTAVWSNSTSFLRISAELNILGLLAYLIVKKEPRKLFSFIWCLAWIMSAGAEIYHLHLIRGNFLID